MGVGATYRQFRSIPKPAEEHFEVTIFDGPVSLAITGDFGPFHGTMSYQLEAVSDTETRLVNTADLQGSGATGMFARVIGGQIKQAVAQNLQVLKTILEK